MLVNKLCPTPSAVAARLLLAALAIFALPSASEAAAIAIDQPGMEAIFSQASFGSTPISIRFNAPRFIVAPQLLDIKDQADLKALEDLAPDPAPTVDAFFVNQVDACGFPEPTPAGLFAGCAQLPGHVFVEESASAALSPATLMGHELGHNLDLPHDFFSGTNLMSPFFPHGPDLTDQQVAAILQSPLIQTDSTGVRFIQITPIAIVANPEPATLLLFGTALGALCILRLKKHGPASHKRPPEIKS